RRSRPRARYRARGRLPARPAADAGYGGRLHLLPVLGGAAAVPRSSRPDPARARRVLAIASVVIVAGQLAAGLALDAAPPSGRFAEGARGPGRAHGPGAAPYAPLPGSARLWKIALPPATPPPPHPSRATAPHTPHPP